MNPQASSDTSVKSCVHCAMQLRDRVSVCPCCGKDPLVADELDDASWFGAGQASENAPDDDHVLAAMMAIAAAKPKLVHDGSVAAVPSPPPPLAPEPSIPLQVLAEPVQPAVGADRAGEATAAAALRRRLLFGLLAVSAAAAALLLKVDGLFPGQRTEPAAVVQPALPLPLVRESAPRDGEPVSTASAEPPMPAPPPSAPSDRPEEDAQAIANALALGERAPQAPVPVAAPRMVPPAAVAPTAVGHTDTPERCSEALAALSLCRKP